MMSRSCVIMVMTKDLLLPASSESLVELHKRQVFVAEGVAEA